MNAINHQPIKAVIWDLDGTLIDSAEYHWRAWQDVARAEQFALAYEDYVADFGKRNDEILRGRFNPDLSDAEVVRIALAKEEVYRELVRHRGLVLLPGAEHWLRKLKADGIKQALGTSAPRGNIDAVFAVLGIEHLFNAVLSSEEVKHGKPAPDVFLAAAAKLEIEPHACLVVEDAPAGIEAARRAGMRSVGVLTTHRGLDADWTFERLDQIPQNFFQ